MSEPIRLFIVTDDPDQAVAYMFECPVAELPAWVRVATTPEEIAVVPAGIRCQDLWYSVDQQHPAAVAWSVRKQAGRVRMMDDKDWDHLVVSLSRRNAHRAAAQPAAASENVAAMPKQSRWF